jgi:outer membrane protein TolC
MKRVGKSSIVLLVLLILLSGRTFAQFLSAEQAVVIALQNNFAIRLSSLNERVLENNVSLGNAGFLPQLDAVATQNNSVTNARQEYLSGQINERDNAKSSTLNAGVELNWTLFDGLRMFTGYDLLRKQLEAGELQTKLEVETTIREVLALYYNIVELRQKVNMFEKSVALGRARTEIADDKLSIGAGSRLELLQARVDMNSDISEMLNLNDLITEATIRMNTLLARNPDEIFSVEDTIVLMPPASFDILKSKTIENNSGLMLNRKDIELAELNLKNIKGRRYPTLDANVGYNYNEQQSESGFVKSGKSDGVNYGLTARLSIFDGFTRTREEKNARIEIQSAQLRYDSYLADVNAQLLATYNLYDNKLKTIELERENMETAFTNFEIANERYRLGELSGIEIREAQQNFLLAQDRLITVIYQARLLEIDLLALSGGLVPED